MRGASQLLVAGILFMAFTLTVAGQTREQESQPPARVQNMQQARAAEDPQWRDDLQKMQVILNQMRTNLAFVGSTTTPLAHQFQLEIDMWQALLDHMKQSQTQPGPNQNPH